MNSIRDAAPVKDKGLSKVWVFIGGILALAAVLGAAAHVIGGVGW